ncbi:hypothetical protein JTE90_026826 [Oedothorax gibbosus]|uniref:Secreted protein n=1 Tax=Oedothorax gibbosus TaxID=931172 RepID=A0AAV6V834_9ARAC|nr:hypothetical protein JTE90_026826 [Oedothorax gibbosus]
MLTVVQLCFFVVCSGKVGLVPFFPKGWHGFCAVRRDFDRSGRVCEHFVLERLEIVNGCLLKCRLFVKTVYLMHKPFKDYSAWLLRTWSGKSFHPLSNICYVR